MDQKICLKFSMNLQFNSENHSLRNYWYTVPLFLIIAVFLAVQYSNANTHLSGVQKQGNYHDDSRLTNAVRGADTLEDVYRVLDWEPVLIAPAYFLYRYFEIETNGRRIISAILVTLSFVYLLVLLAHHGVLDHFGLLVFAFLFSISGELTVYTSTGLLGYPLLVLLSVFLVNILLNYFGQTLSLKSCLAISVVFASIVLINNRAILAVFAVGFTLSSCVLFRKSISIASVYIFIRQSATLLAAPLFVWSVLLFYFAPPELTNPHRGLESYFFTSSHPPTVIGAFNFYVQNSISLFYAAMSPHPLVEIAGGGARIGVFLGVFFLIGLVTSWKSKAFAISLFFLLGSLGHIFLNLITLVPYGNLRYFLPFFITYPVITACGVSYVVQKFRRAVPIHSDPGFSKIIYLACSVAVLAILFRYQTATVRYNEVNEQTVDEGVSYALTEVNNGSATIVTDVWTDETMRADQRIQKGDASFVFNTNFKSAWKNQAANELDDISQWRAFLLDQNEFSTITSIPFSKEYFGEFYSAALEQFEIQSLPGTRRYFFKRLSKRDGDFGRSIASFEQFELQVGDGARVTTVKPHESLKGRSGTALSVEFGSNSEGVAIEGGALKWVFSTAMRPEQVLSASTYLWSDRELIFDGNLIFQVARNDGGMNEYKNLRVARTGKKPERIQVDLSFAIHHESVRIALIYRGNSPVTIYMTPPILQY